MIPETAMYLLITHIVLHCETQQNKGTEIRN